MKNGREKAGRSGCDILSVYVKGGPRYELDGVVYPATPPMAILIPAGTMDHDLQVGPVDGTFVLFRSHGLLRRAGPGRVAVAAAAGTAGCIVPILRRVGPSQAARLQELVRRIGGISSHHPQGCLRRVAFLLEALSEYCTAPDQGGRPAIHREAQHLRELIDSRAFEGGGMAPLYRETGLSPTRAATLFRQAFGLSPVAYRIRVRLARARELLMSTRRNVGEVAAEVGFSDPLYFSRQFRRCFGVPPSKLIRDFAVSRR